MFTLVIRGTLLRAPSNEYLDSSIVAKWLNLNIKLYQPSDSVVYLYSRFIDLDFISNSYAAVIITKYDALCFVM